MAQVMDKVVSARVRAVDLSLSPRSVNAQFRTG